MSTVPKEVPVMENVIAYLMLFIGVPYKWGGNNPLEGFDCSGLVCEGLRTAGILTVDHDSQGIFEVLKAQGRRSGLSRGSVLFFGQTQHSISHVSIALDDKRMLESGGGDRTTTTLSEAIRRNAFVRIRPIRNDLVAALRID